MKKIFKLKKTQPLAIGGEHTHEPEDSSNHTHTFIVGVLTNVTKNDGMHTHDPKNSSLSGVMGHKHSILINNTTFETESENTHIHHEPATKNGEHSHMLFLENGSEIKSLTKDDIFDVEIKKRLHINIQSISFDKNKFTSFEESAKWAIDNGFRINELNDIGKFFTFTQLSKDRFVVESLKEHILSDGVIAVIGTLKDVKPKVDNVIDTSFDEIRDVINTDENILTEQQLRMLDSIKKEYKDIVAELKTEINLFIPTLTSFVELSNNILNSQKDTNDINDLGSSYNALANELNNLNIDVIKRDESTVDNLETNIEKISILITKVDDMLEGTTLTKLGTLLKFAIHSTSKIKDSILPILKSKNINKSLDKFFNTSIDLKTITKSQLENLSSDAISNLRIENITEMSSDVNLVDRMSQLLDKLSNTGKVTLDLGCGDIKEPTDIGIDIVKTAKSDLIYDLNVGIPLPDNSIDVIKANNVLEFIENSNRVTIMNEVFRVLKNNGKFISKTSSTDGRNAFLTCNKSHWNEAVFDEFDGESLMNRNPEIKTDFRVTKMTTKINKKFNSAVVECTLVAVKKC